MNTLTGKLKATWNMKYLHSSRVNTILRRRWGTITYARTIYTDGDVIQYLAEQVFGATVKVASEFLRNATNPLLRIANRYNYLTIAQKTDILYPTSSNPATKGPTCL